MKQQCLILRGLPGSGKSTYAHKLVQEKNFVRINRDELRLMLHGERAWSPSDETVTARTRDALIIQALLVGRDVVVDDTNIAPHTINQVRSLAEPLGVEVIIQDIEIAIHICIARDAARLKPVGERRIREMANQLATVHAEEYAGKLVRDSSDT